MKTHNKVKLQKNKVILILGTLLALCGVAVGIIVYMNYSREIIRNKLNVEWYSAEEETFTISTADELYELARLSDFYDFKDQTITLDADIVVNEGNAEDWAEEPPQRVWFPIQGFAGTFDGQGHTISGLYGSGSGTPMGLFSDTNTKCKIKDLRLVNSYFYQNGTQGVGAITSNGSGTFEKLYVDAIVAGNRYYIGGIIGRVDSGKESSVIARSTKISNCWFDGEIRLTSGTSRMAGGLIGGIEVGNVRVEHSMSSGSLLCAEEKEAYNAGGLCGTVGVYKGKNKSVTLHLEDCLHVGTIETPYKTSVGSVIGNVYAGTRVNVTNTYTEKSELMPTDVSSGVVSGDALSVRPQDLIGQEAYRWTGLDFDRYWNAIQDDTPMLKCFSKDGMNLEGVKKAFNTDWYDEELSEFIIDSVEDLYGFQMLCNQNVTFEGKTVKLANDIIVNEGKATDWSKGKNIPELEWTPIGGGGNKHRPFSGTFDGQGHTVSGIYMKSDGYYLGFFGVLNMKGTSTIKNFKLVNSYFECTRTEALGSEIDGLGSIAGQGAGVLDTVYSDAIVVSATRNVGGFIGNQRQKESPLTVTNCWFNGSVTGTQWMGGVVGYVDYYVAYTNISDCLITADFTSTMTEGNSLVGGLLGRVGTANISSCLVVGDFVGQNVMHGLTARSMTKKDEKLIISKCYDATTNTKVTHENGSSPAVAIKVNRLKKEDLIGTKGYENTLLSFYNSKTNKSGKWIAVAGDVPQLRSFTNKKALNVAGIPRGMEDVDISWYDDSKSTFTLTKASQLYGLAALCNSQSYVSFKEKTIKLGKDIVVNTGSATDWAQGKNLPKYTWTPIGGGENSDNHRPFAGTFDGQGHTISGLYMKSNGYYMGLFGVLAKEGYATVKNLKLTNSYFECTKQDALGSELEGLGSIAGQGAGTLDTIYSDAILVSSIRNVGGLMGNQRQAKSSLKVNNCWFDGSITGTQWLGGIVGFIDGNTEQTDLSNCLVTADITATVEDGKNAYIGGLTARIANGKVDSCVVTGELKGSGLVSGLIGMSVTKTTQKLELIKCYNASNESRLYDTALQKPIISEVKNVSLEQLKGTQAYTYTLLEFYDANRNKDAKWVLVENQSPELRSFTKATYMADLGSLQDVARPLMTDTSWYNTTGTTFTISTVEQLYGFAELCNSGNKFAGKTIKLGADITVNKGKATDWENGKNVPATNWWTPIGGGVSSNDYIGFAGTFDGQGHTISGLYMKSDGLYLGLFGTLAMDGSSTIKNLKLTNCYFECTREKANGNELDGLGSIAGQGAGVIDTVYSDAIVVSKTHNAGGLIGNQRQKNSPLNIQNSWFDGKVTGTQWVGGIIGFVYKDVAYTNMTDCLVTADLTSTAPATNAAYIGGLSGRLSKGEVRSCVAQGTIVTPETESNPTGFIRAIVDTATLYNMYNAMEWNGKSVENYLANVAPTTEKLYKLSKNSLKGTKAYEKTLLDFYDKNTNITGKWVLRQNELLALKSFAGQDYMDDLSSLAETARPIVVDTSWYNDSDTEFTLATADELYGLAQLCNAGNTFAGKTIKLGNNIVVNNGTMDPNAAEYAEAGAWDAAVKDFVEWIPIGGGSGALSTEFAKQFAGTFDGQGHTISGLYMKRGGYYLGLFGITSPDGSSTIQNFKLTNCYLERTAATAQPGYEIDGLGSIVGLGFGTLKNIYSDAVIVNNQRHTGGLVGCASRNAISGTGGLSINNCWYNGKATGTQWIGGILGFAHNTASDVHIKDCLVTADLTCTGSLIGGLVGRFAGGTIDSCIARGTIVTADGAPFGIVRSIAGTVTLSNLYNAMQSNGQAVSNHAYSRPSDSNVEQISEDNLKGQKAYTKTALNFYIKDTNEEGVWVAIKENGLPELKIFALPDMIDELVGVSRPVVADTKWYNESATEFTINTAGELYGLAVLCNGGNSFVGKTIKLGNNIIVNNRTMDPKAKEYEQSGAWAAAEADFVNWIPIGGGTNCTTYNTQFAGTFDGQGYTISGLYMKRGGYYLGLFGVLDMNGRSVIQNLKLTNSYFEKTTAVSEPGYRIDGLGSIAGHGFGRLDTIYSDVILVNKQRYTGGLVGCVGNDGGGTGTLSVNNCWYEGRATGTMYVGGILGYADPDGSPIVTTNITNCLVNADLETTNDKESVTFIGGIAGVMKNGVINSCLVTGNIVTKANDKSPAGLVRSIYGTATLQNLCYSMKVNGELLKSNYNSAGSSANVSASNFVNQSEDKLKGSIGYTNYLHILDFYDKDLNDDGKWVLIENQLPELKSFTKWTYAVTLPTRN